MELQRSALEKTRNRKKEERERQIGSMETPLAIVHYAQCSMVSRNHDYESPRCSGLTFPRYESRLSIYLTGKLTK
ncbi:hypothetical protein ALC57_16804 [Trachymyrmex cornetzi]|uniref:Uncharacterized protein n=1 Tax=Trachymyrmex cornetzi TaxID=471704 RepID=A0A151IUV3_9HYME|nr:hypothetical protein ALC57_16804 [Trachymyrmex cornetzi]